MTQQNQPSKTGTMFPRHQGWGMKCMSGAVHIAGCMQGFGPGWTPSSHRPEDGNTMANFNQQLQLQWISSYKKAVRSLNLTTSLCDSEKQQGLEA